MIKFFLQGHQITIRVQAGLFDLPAKAAFLKCKQWNGQFGCIQCYHPGEHSFAFKKRIYPPKPEVNFIIFYRIINQKTHFLSFVYIY